MPDTMLVSDVIGVLEPVFAEMLKPKELATLEYWIERVDQRGIRLAPDDDVARIDSWVRWSICGEEGGSRALDPAEPDYPLVAAVQGDLQDFIAESSFGWGQLRGPLGLP